MKKDSTITGLTTSIICSGCKLYHFFFFLQIFIFSSAFMQMTACSHLTVYVRECRIFEVSRTLWSRYRKYCNMTVAWTVCGLIKIKCKKKMQYDHFSYHGGWENTNPFASEQYKIIVSPSNTGEVAMTLDSSDSKCSREHTYSLYYIIFWRGCGSRVELSSRVCVTVSFRPGRRSTPPEPIWPS